MKLAEPKEPDPTRGIGPPRTSLNSAVTTPLASAALDGSSGSRQRSANVVVFDWRFAARVCEQTRELHAIDFALTATGLAAEIRDWLGRS